VISSNNVSRILAFAYQISTDNFDKIKSFSTVIPIVYVVSVRRLVPSAVNQSLVVALVLKRLDCRNAAQAGLPSYLHRPLNLSILVGRQPIHRSDLFTDTLASFHWRRLTERNQFKLTNIIYTGHCTAQHSASCPVN
jgi:hypothetical protein